MISVAIDGKEIVQISDDEIKVMQYDTASENIIPEIKQRIIEAINAKIYSSKAYLQNAWIPAIRQKYDTWPTKDAAIANVIFKEPDYKDYDQRAADLLKNSPKI